MKIKALNIGAVVFAAILLLLFSSVAAQSTEEELEQQKTIIGPRNPFLADGADALRKGHGQRGVELTEKGLEIAKGSYEHKAALSNLCVGYLMIKEPERALEFCNRVLEEDPEFWRAYNNRALVYMELERYAESKADIERGQALRPNSRHLKVTKSIFLDLTEPVVPVVEIDERRNAGADYADDSNL